MKNKLLSFIAVIVMFFIGTGCELPGSSSNNDTTASGGTSGTGGNQSAGQINGAWQGTFQETSINTPGALGNGILYFTFNQSNSSSFSGGGYFQRSGMPQANLNGFSNGIITGNNISFTATNGPLSPLGSDTLKYSGILSGNTIIGTYERTVVTQGRPAVVIKGNFSLSAGGTTTGSTTINITGHWEGTYNDTAHSTGILGSGIISFNFTQTGNNLSGNGANLTVNGSYIVTSGMVNGSNVNFVLSESSNDPNNQWTSSITDVGIINGTTMSGTYEAITSFQNPSRTETSKGNFTLNKI